MNPFEEIAKVHPTIPGWASLQKAITLASIVVATRPMISIEIGVFGGKSCLGMAMAHRYIGFGHLIAIDPWMARDSIKGQGEADTAWWADQKKHDQVYSSFAANRISLGLQSQIQVERKTSDDFSPPDDVGVLSIDGNHGPQAVIDAQRYGSKVALGGIAVLDDLEWSKGFVTQAVAELMKLGFIELYVVDDAESKNKWGVYQRVTA